MGQLKKILLVDDDDDLREALSEQLVMTEDFDVFEAANGSEAMSKAKDAIYDLVILDVGLPDTDGRELCRLMRKQGVKSPIMMLTGHDGDADTILVPMITSPNPSNFRYFWPVSAPNCASTSNPKTPYSSLGHIRSSPR